MKEGMSPKEIVTWLESVLPPGVMNKRIKDQLFINIGGEVRVIEKPKKK